MPGSFTRLWAATDEAHLRYSGISAGAVIDLAIYPDRRYRRQNDFARPSSIPAPAARASTASSFTCSNCGRCTLVRTRTPLKITADSDQRIHWAGRYSQFKIDELPQLWNVLRGEMSIVGPRPEDWEIVQQFYTDEQRQTLAVRPGIFSTAEVRWYPDLTYHDPPPPGVSIEEHYLKTTHASATRGIPLLFAAPEFIAGY